MKSKDLEGLKYFAQTLQEMGAQVSLASSRPIQGDTPMLHSKLVVADRLVAYVGSANFTKSGLDHGFEAGVAARGLLAAAFAGWTNSLRTICDVENNFEKWATRSSAE